MKKLTDKQIRKLASIDTPTISNAIENFHLRCPTEGFMGMEIKSLFQESGVMVGYAVTATMDSTTPSMGKKRKMQEFFHAVKESPKPVVVVIKAKGQRPYRTCVTGELFTLAMKKLGVVGMVTDGAIRDIQQIRKMGFHVFACGAVPSHGIPSIDRINVPIEISDLKIHTGDLIHADENGVLKIPWECVDKLVAESKKILRDEKSIIKSLKSPGFSSKTMRFFCGKGRNNRK